MIRRLYACWVLIAVSGLCPHALAAQERTILRAADTPPVAACAFPVLDDSQRFNQGARLDQRPYLYFDSVCPAPGDNRPLEGARAVADLPTAAVVDPVEEELETMGAPGFLIGRAREEVLEILREGNSCSAWYAAAEPSLVVKFASLHFRVDEQGLATVLGEFNSGNVFFREPYVARAQENVGSGSFITLNAHGAFFHLRASARFRFETGGPFTAQPPKQLHVADYPGGSRNAQVTTLLHEFGHIVGILPIDSGEPRSALLSTRNTETLLRHCRKQIEASRDRAILLPVALAGLERSAREP